MKVVFSTVLSLLILFHSVQATAQLGACPVTSAEDPLVGAATPGWYGTEGLAVRFSSEAMIWPTTESGALMAGRLLWRSAGFRPGMESDFKAEIENLGVGPVTARISDAANAYIPSSPPGRARLTESEAEEIFRQASASNDGWTMLTGVHFPEPGCWRISAEFLGQKLTFVMESVPRDEWTADRAPEGKTAYMISPERRLMMRTNEFEGGGNVPTVYRLP